jgi:thiol-disulfide isomerase/thioredoxin
MLTLALGLVVSASFTASAQGFGISTGDAGTGISMDGGEKKTKKKKKSKKSADKKTASASAVGKAVGKLKTFNGKPSKKALVYVYLQSASWCGPCNKEMPEVAEIYKEMKKDGRAEVILIGADKTEDAAKKFLKQYKAKFPGILIGGKNVDQLPGFTPARGIPNATMVDAEGNVLANGFPSTVLPQWKQAVENLEAADSAEEETETTSEE